MIKARDNEILYKCIIPWGNIYEDVRTTGSHPGAETKPVVQHTGTLSAFPGDAQHLLLPMTTSLYWEPLVRPFS